MNNFTFDLQAFAWTHVNDEQWRYSSGSNSFVLYGDYSEDEDDDGNLIPQGVSVAGSNATIDPDWTTAISITGGSFHFVDDYESFEARLSNGESATHEDDNWSVSGAGYICHSYNYFDSDVTVRDLDEIPSSRMSTSTSTDSGGFTRYTVNTRDAEVSDYATFSINGVIFRQISSSGSNHTIIPYITRITLNADGLIFTDYDYNEFAPSVLAGVFSNYNSSTHTLTLMDDAAWFEDATTLDIEVEDVSAGLKVVCSSFVAFVANDESISVNTDDATFNIDYTSWAWDASTNTLYFDINRSMTGISNVGASTTITLTDEQIIVNGAVLTNAAIDDDTISGTDTNPSNGYTINITDDGYEFAEDQSSAVVVASVAYNSNRTFTFRDQSGANISYADASVSFTTLNGGIVIGSYAPADVTISSAVNSFSIFGNSIANANIVAQLNAGDVYSNGSIVTDNDAVNAWIRDGSTVVLGDSTSINGITVESTTSIVKSGNFISIYNATLENGSINGAAINGSDDNPADGYMITIVGGTPSFVEPEVEATLSSITYNGEFTFVDTNGATLSYDVVSPLISTAEGGLITLNSSDASNVTVTSYAAAALVIYDRSTLRAKLHAGDAFVGNRVVTDSNDTNAWAVDGNNLTLGVDVVTIEGITVSNASSVVKSDDLITITDATLNGSARINGMSIAGTDDDPEDGYRITLAGGTASFLAAEQTLASIGYDGSYTFLDTRGRAMTYDLVSSILTTEEGGSITLSRSAPDNVTVTSAVDNLYLYNDLGDRTVIMARVNAGDSYVSDERTGSLVDADPINSWITNPDLDVINVGTITLTGVSGISSLTSAAVDGNLVILNGATLDDSARINGNMISGADEDISDGYLITLASGGWRFIQTTIPAWTSIDGGFVYSSNDVEFTLLGAALVDSDADGEPDNIGVNVSTVDDIGRVLILTGLNGEVSINGTALGISGDSDYAAGFILDAGDWIADAFTNISPGATVNADGAIVYTDGDGDYTFVDGIYTLNDAAITLDNNDVNLVLSIGDNSITSIGNAQENLIVNGVGDASVSVVGAATINGIAYRTDDPNGVVVSGSTVDGLDSDRLLYVSPSGTYVVNSSTVVITDDTAALGVNSTLAAAASPANLRIHNVFDIPDDATFISAAQIRATMDATGSNTLGGYAFDGNKIIELNEKDDGAVVDMYWRTGQKFVMIDGGGDQKVTFGRTTQNGLLVEDGATGSKMIEAGDGGDTLINDSDEAYVTLKGGRGADSIVASGSGREVIDLAYGSEDTVNAPSGALIRGYNPASGAAFITPIRKSELLAAIEDQRLTFGVGTFSISGGGETTIEGTEGSTTVNLLDDNGDAARVAFVNHDNASIGAEDASIDMLLYGDLAELTLLGGIGNDTVLVGEGSLVDGGDGDDRISLRAGGVGNDVRMSAGDDTVEVFEPNWDEYASDRLIVSDNDNSIHYTFRGAHLYVTSDHGTMLVPSIKGDTSTKLFMSSTYEDAAKRTVLIDESMTYVVESSVDAADRYIGLGDRTGVDLSSEETDRSIDLNGKDFQNIAEVTLGSGNNSVVGTSESETIAAGRGRSTIESGDGNDMLIASTSENRTGGSTFIYSAGLDTIENFEAIGAGTEDEVIFNAGLTQVESFGNDVVIEAGAIDQLTLMDAADKKIKVNGGIFKAGSSLTYEYNGGVDAYVGTGNYASLALGESGGNIWLNGWDGQLYANVRVLDGTAGWSNETLVGGTNMDNILVGGSGSTSLWGGSGGNDTLNGGLGYNEYYYLYGDGWDEINNARDDDVIRMLNIGDDEIAWESQEVTGNRINVRFNDGGGLTVNSRADVIFEKSDGSRWSVDRASGSWYRRN